MKTKGGVFWFFFSVLQLKEDEHVKLRESKNMTKKESVSTARGRERLNNTRRMGEERNRDNAADKIQEKVQISTEMEMENRHTYLG